MENPSAKTSSGKRTKESNCFPAQLRIKSRSDFSRVYARGKVVADENLVIHAILASTPETRLGLSLSKKVGHAPLRNRWKRLIREAFRTQRQSLPTGMLIVVRPRRGAQPNYLAIRNSLVRLCRRLERKL